MLTAQGIWYVLILILLLLSLSLPGVFLGTIAVFYTPIVLGFLYMIWDLIGTLWFVVVLICFVILSRLDYLL
jgi:hypothetical protein